jgi:hypothetical protein
MTEPQSTSQRNSCSSEVSIRGSFANALRAWEPRRALYNFILALVVGEWLLATWPHFRPAFHLSSLLLLSVLALLANVCFCAAYLVDIPLQRSAAVNRLTYYRWALWTIGTLLAISFANYWISDEIYPYVN